MRLRLVWALIFVACWMGSGVARAQDDVDMSVTAEGVAAVSDNDYARAEDEALTNAKRSAVEQAVGVFVKSESRGEDFGEIVEEKILTRSEGYLTKWSIVEGSRKIEKIDGNSLLRIKITAKVRLLSLIDDMIDTDEIYNQMQRPRVMVLISENSLGKRTKDSIAASAIIRELQDRQFDVVDPEAVDNLKKKESIRLQLDQVDAKTASLLALEEGAEILILGKASTTKNQLPGDIPSDIISYQATVNARLIDPNTGANLFTPKPAKAKGVDFSSDETASEKALDAAGTNLISQDAKRFQTQLFARWAKEITNGRTLRVIARGVSYEQFNELKKAIRNLRGHVELMRESFLAGKATLDLRTHQTPELFRSTLAEMKLGKRKIQVNLVSGTVTEISLN